MIPLGTLWAVVIAAVGLVLTLMNIVDKVSLWRERARKPDEEQNDRIRKLEEGQVGILDRLAEHERFFAADKSRIDQLEQGIRHSNKIIIQSLRALSKHAIDGNNTEQLKDSTKALDEYLLDR